MFHYFDIIFSLPIFLDERPRYEDDCLPCIAAPTDYQYAGLYLTSSEYYRTVERKALIRFIFTYRHLSCPPLLPTSGYSLEFQYNLYLSPFQATLESSLFRCLILFHTYDGSLYYFFVAVCLTDLSHHVENRASRCLTATTIYISDKCQNGRRATLLPCAITRWRRRHGKSRIAFH